MPSRSMATDVPRATFPPAADPVAFRAGSDLCSRGGGAGAGPAVLLLHGVTGSHRYWNRAVRHLERRRRVVRPDMMGFGRSPKPGVRYDLTNQAVSLRGFLVAHRLDAARLDVIGHSLGALIALRYGVLWPGHLRRVVLVGLPAHRTREEAHRGFLAGSANYRWLIGQPSLGATLRSWAAAGPAMAARYLLAFSPGIVADSRRWTFHSLSSTVEHALLAQRAEPLATELAALPEARRPRVLVLHGRRDQVAPAAAAARIAGLIPGSDLHLLDGTGHHPFRTHAARCSRVALRFLGGASGGPCAQEARA